jgi:hypothetical protein
VSRRIALLKSLRVSPPNHVARQVNDPCIREVSSVTKDRRKADRASGFSSLRRQRDNGHDSFLARASSRRSNTLPNRIFCRSKQSNP